jgi:hypothetical protein
MVNQSASYPSPGLPPSLSPSLVLDWRETKGIQVCFVMAEPFKGLEEP